MTISELIAELQKFPQDYVVILSKDEEGNGFHQLNALSAEQVDDPTSYYIDIYDEGEPNAVILWP